jgi:site-specific DNA-methyltransferase (adenine-specific)
METNIVYQEDCIEGMKKIPDNSIDLVLTDPPYSLNKEGIENDDSLWGYELDFYRVLKDDCWMCTYCSIGKVAEVIKILEANGFKYVWQHITYINNGMVRGRLGFNRYMLCLIFAKGEPKLKSIITDVYECSTSSQQRHRNPHPTPKKVLAIKNLIQAFSKEGQLVLDPFMGSGTTAIACKQIDREYIGFEISPQYIKIINKRLAQSTVSDFTSPNGDSVSQKDLICIKEENQK